MKRVSWRTLRVGDRLWDARCGHPVVLKIEVLPKHLGMHGKGGRQPVAITTERGCGWMPGTVKAATHFGSDDT